MAEILDNAMMQANTTGTATAVSLGNIITGYQSFANAGAVNNQVFSYGIQDTSNTWELGRGTYITNSTGNFVLRTTIRFSSNNGGPINLSGNGQIYSTFLDDDYETLSIANSLNIGANLIVNTSVFFFGNSIANSFGNSTLEIIANATSQTVVTPQSISIGNSTANSAGNSVADWVINSTANTILTPGTITLAGAGSNAGLIVGTNSQGTAIGANGYSFLPNGFLMQWGAISVANASTSFAFPATFSVNCFALTVTVANSTAGDGFQNLVASAIITNTSHFAATSGNNSTARTCYFLAIGK